MAYYPDLSASDGVIRIGWLDPREPFVQGVIEPVFLHKLTALYEKRVRQSRGFHPCRFCEVQRFGLPIQIGEKTLTLGSAEIEVEGIAGRVYAAPDLIHHYITEHRYLPPQEFIDAVYRDRWRPGGRETSEKPVTR